MGLSSGGIRACERKRGHRRSDQKARKHSLFKRSATNTLEEFFLEGRAPTDSLRAKRKRKKARHTIGFRIEEKIQGEPASFELWRLREKKIRFLTNVSVDLRKKAAIDPGVMGSFSSGSFGKEISSWFAHRLVCGSFSAWFYLGVHGQVCHVPEGRCATFCTKNNQG
ncbi:hypothetical protein MPNT_10425 [Candidatus Methylacidithermus pantelleriae]|uniref:Uncharacterized protein n=1 Tax=Candidatus Methylacidithermus pantelleriae TaxID=2744239 RepID=A0A8J2BR50_9BACT|nr:hypothetical protein MPNT_10425 [Candidatus Methylacidithermus pantelleriae]